MDADCWHWYGIPDRGDDCRHWLAHLTEDELGRPEPKLTLPLGPEPHQTTSLEAA